MTLNREAEERMARDVMEHGELYEALADADEESAREPKWGHNGPRFALDVEEVLAATHQPMLNWYNSKHGTEWELEDLDSWNFGETGITIDEFLYMSHMIWKEDWANIVPCEPNLDLTIRDLAKWAQVDIVTARTGCDDEILKWLELQGIDSWTNFRVIPGNNKWRFDYDAYIDDHPHMKNVYMQYLVDRPWNADTEGPQVIRVPTVKDVLSYRSDWLVGR